MQLSELIDPERVLLPFEADSRWDAIEQMVARLVRIGAVPEAESTAVLEAVRRREATRSTGMEHGIALPHGPVDCVDSVQAVLAISRNGVPFEALDRKPAQIILLLVVPYNLFQQHVRTLAGIARLLNEESLRRRLTAATSAEEVCGLIREDVASRK